MVGRNNNTGDFIDGKMSGTGVLHWPSGETYTGDFLNGHMDGKGVHTRADGSLIYDGDWIESCPVNAVDR